MKAVNLFLQHLKESTLKKNSLTHYSISILQMFGLCFTFQCEISSLSSLQKIYLHVSIAHTNTDTSTHTNTYINFHLLWQWTSPTSEYILFFSRIHSFCKYMQ